MQSKHSEPAAILFLLPAGIIYVSAILFPIAYSLYLSLFTGSGINNWEFCGMQNYVKLLQDKVFLLSLRNSVIWMMLTLVFTTSFSLLLALILNRRFFGRTFFRGLFYFPTVIAMIAVAIIWRWIYHPNLGFINQFSKAVGLNFSQTWLSNPKSSLIACFVAAQWTAVGQPMILFLAGLQGISEDVIEAARIDGAKGLKLFFSITIPLLKNTFVVVLSTLMIGALKIFDIIVGLTDGGPNNASQVIASYMYSQTFEYSHWGYGASIACFMVLIMLIIIVPYVSFMARDT